MSGTKKRVKPKTSSDLVRRLDEEMATLGFETDKAFCEHARISTSSMSRLRSGERGVDVETLLKIASGLGRSVDWLLTGREEDRPRVFTFPETSLETIRDAIDIALQHSKGR